MCWSYFRFLQHTYVYTSNESLQVFITTLPQCPRFTHIYYHINLIIKLKWDPDVFHFAEQFLIDFLERKNNPVSIFL